jgi:hypothetical protein
MSKKSLSSREPFVRRSFGGPSSPVRISIALIVGLSFLLAAGASFAQANKYSFSKRNQKKVSKVIMLLQTQGTDEEVDAARVLAIENLNNINLKRAKPYGRARIHQLLGTLAVQDENFEEGLDHLVASLSEDAIQPELALSTQYQVGQLQTMLERYDEAVETLEAWIMLVETPSPSNYYTLAATYFQAATAAQEKGEDARGAELLTKALDPARKAIELSSETPREAWYRLLLSLHLTKSEYVEALAVLDDVILAYPNKSYWSQLAAIYSALDHQDKSLAAQLLAKDEGFVTEDRDVTRVAQMFMVEGLPHRGAEIMQAGLDDGVIEPTKQAYQTYSDTLLQSREWALAVDPLAKAAELNDDGSLFIRLAQVNIQLMRWGDARDSINRAFDKGSLTDEGQAHLLFGIAAANDREWAQASAAFDRAAKHEGTAVTAIKWKQHVQREKARFGDN